jgi:hypothetical protein
MLERQTAGYRASRTILTICEEEKKWKKHGIAFIGAMALRQGMEIKLKWKQKKTSCLSLSKQKPEPMDERLSFIALSKKNNLSVFYQD